jgi:hypothetical protein
MGNAHSSCGPMATMQQQHYVETLMHRQVQTGQLTWVLVKHGLRNGFKWFTH